VSLPLASGNATEAQDKDFVSWLPRIWHSLLYTYVYTLLGADKVSEGVVATSPCY
jgi:hypothetical protein